MALAMDAGDAERDVSRSGLILSALFHVAVLGFIIVKLPDLFAPKPLEDTPIAVQLVTLADETKATQLTKTPPKPNAKPAPTCTPGSPWSWVPLSWWPCSSCCGAWRASTCSSGPRTTRSSR